MRTNEPVAVPHPGVPSTISVTLDDLYDGGATGGVAEEKENGEEFFDTYFDMNDEDQDSFTK